MNPLDRILIYLTAPFLLAHELSHYLAARLLGIEAQLHLTHVDLYDYPSRGQNLVITLAPAVLGLVVGLLWLWLVRHSTRSLIEAGATLLVWQIACGYDLLKAWQLLAETEGEGKR